MSWDRIYKIEDLQRTCLNSIINFSVSYCEESYVQDLLFSILIEDLEFMGKYGENLKRFVSSIDIYHPGLEPTLKSIFGNEFSKVFEEIITLSKLVKKESGLGGYLSQIFKLMSKEFSKNALLRVDAPSVNGLHVRFIETLAGREKVRNFKEIQLIDLKSFYKKGEEFWKFQPFDFSFFLRFNSTYEKELIAAERKADRYKELGCTSLFNEIKRAIDFYKEQVEDSYYGFNRITMTNAAIILAKASGYKLVGKKDSLRIVADRNCFSNSTDCFFVQPNDLSWNYTPRAYPLHKVWDFAPDRIKQCFDYLENFPSAYNKSIFDHYIVVVPGIDGLAPSLDENTFKFYKEAENPLVFSGRDNALMALDKAFIEGQYFVPVVLGERDGKCYFICYFI